MVTTTTTTTTPDDAAVNGNPPPVRVMKVPVVQASREEQVATTPQADIPLARDQSGETLLQVSLPEGVGATSEETITSSSTTLRELLIAASNPRVQEKTVFDEILDEGIDSYVPTVRVEQQVAVRTVTFESSGSLPTQPIIVTGATGTGEDDIDHPDRQEALVVDTRQLPSGTVLQFDKVEFAIVIGAARIEGGEGRNFVVGDDAAQYIVLGEADDTLRGGGGDDTIGSKGGDDRLYGDSGNDRVVGGTGDDQLFGGDGDDILQGGGSDAGVWSFSVSPTETLQVSYAATESGLNEIGSAAGEWNRELVDYRVDFVLENPGKVAMVAQLYQAVYGRLPDNTELRYWSHQELDGQGLAAEFLSSYRQLAGPLPETQEGQVRQLFEWVWGEAREEWVAAGIDYLEQGGSWEEGLLVLSQHANNTGPITDEQGNLRVVQDIEVDETGWYFDGGNDWLSGGAGNDRLIGGVGNNLLDGGEGVDLAEFIGVVGDYTLEYVVAEDGSGDLVLTNRHSGESNTLRNLEAVKVGGEYLGLRDDAPELAVGEVYPLEDFVRLMGQAEVETMGYPDAWF